MPHCRKPRPRSQRQASLLKGGLEIAYRGAGISYVGVLGTSCRKEQHKNGGAVGASGD